MSSRKPAGIATAIPEASVTVQRPVYTEWKKVRQPNVACANIAVTELSPDGATDGGYKAKHSEQTVLQQHCDFFDLNSDGIITPWETFVSMRLLGWNVLLAFLATFIIHSGLSYVTQPSHYYLPDPFFRIYISRIHHAKHGSDTNTYDNEGRFRPQQLADFFSKYGTKMENGDYGLTLAEAMKGVWGQRCVYDFFGVASAYFEWSATYLTIWPRDRIMCMEDVRGVYDGSYFFKVAGKKREEYISDGKLL
ncbi:Caleosin related protein-domain-containing protein [Irpex rosettiformis]|uniref:Caleosin related protein-domain-containing protein n=1 Tax=Irpex rosettiformis TaxID=378272 RepID=A0ACB8U2H7_9APHY|nr:Caleosin related protein-domain-containing protein [Irpex rosettiformis]